MDHGTQDGIDSRGCDGEGRAAGQEDSRAEPAVDEVPRLVASIRRILGQSAFASDVPNQPRG
jgi:hypothetical protein